MFIANPYILLVDLEPYSQGCVFSAFEFLISFHLYMMIEYSNMKRVVISFLITFS